jgi:hypothetical protein
LTTKGIPKCDEIIDQKSDKTAIFPDDGWTTLNGKNIGELPPGDGNYVFDGKMDQQVGSRHVGGVPSIDS